MTESQETWGLDENWFIRSPNNFFKISDVIFLTKEGSLGIVVGFDGNNVNINFKAELERDDIFDLLIKSRLRYEQSSNEHSDFHHNMQAAQLEIQNKLAGYMIK